MMSDRAEILDTIVPIIRKYLPERLQGTAITETTQLSRDLGINSALVVELVLTLEDVMALQPGDSYAFETVSDLIEYVIAHR
jgi:acyl carrier protein